MNARRQKLMRRRSRHAFTILEVLVVVAIIGVLASLALPGISAAHGQAKRIVCGSNIQQIMLANTYYAEDFGGTYCPGADRMIENLHRWHGTRNKANQPFEPALGPLVPYFGPDGAIQQCPTFPAREIALDSGGFERGNGGYGYNNAFIGVQVEELSTGEYRITSDRAGALADRVRRPAETVMFTDAAFAARTLIEYSFVEPRFHPQYPSFRADPSIHFRHRTQANVGWCDGHVAARHRTLTWSSGLYPADPARLGIGWFGKRDDNSLLDLK